MCPSQQLAALEGMNFRGGAVIEADDQVYAVTDDHRMHCYRTSGSPCPLFEAGGIPTGLGNLIAPLTKANAIGNMDQVLDIATGRITTP
ncbi:MAG: hypothetical protein ACKVK3_02405 [Acidimicrobiales bacterium]